MICKMCQARGKTWNGDDPKCAFEKGPFADNWNCATASLIRTIIDTREESPMKKAFRVQHCENEENYATIDVSEVNGLGGAGKHPLALWVQWYKNRGRTDSVLLMFGNGNPPRPPTEEECLAILRAHGITLNDTPATGVKRIS